MTFKVSKVADPATLPIGALGRIRHSPDGRWIMGAGAAADGLNLFKRNNAKDPLVKSLSSLSGAQQTSPRNGNWSLDSQYFCYGSTVSPYVSVWKNNGSDVFVKQANTVFDSAAASAVSDLGFHEVEPILFCGFSSGTVGAWKYDTASNTFKRISIFFSGGTPTGNNYQTRMSPDGKWMALANSLGSTLLLFRIRRDSEFSWTLIATSVSLINGTFTGQRFGVAWSADSRVFVVTGTNVSRAFRVNNTNNTATEINLTGAVAVNYGQFSADGRYFVQGTQRTASPSLQIWPYDDKTGTFGTQLDLSAWPGIAAGDVRDCGFTPDGLSLYACSQASPYIHEWKLGDGGLYGSLQSIQMQAEVDLPNGATLAASLGSVKMNLVGYSGDPGWPVAYDDLRATNYIQITPFGPDPRIKPVRTIEADMRLGKITTALTTHFNLEAFVDSQLQPMQMSAIGGQPNSADVGMELGRISSEIVSGPYRVYGEFELKPMQMAAVMGPYRAYGDFQLQPIEMAAEIKKANLNGELAVSLGAIEMAAEMYNPYLGYMAMELGRISAEIVGSAPATATADMRLGKITTQIDAVIPDVARVDMQLGKISTEIDVVIPDVARITTSLNRIEMAGEMHVPYVVRAAMSLQRISTDGYVMVPTVARIAAGLQPIQMQALSFSIAYTDMIMRLPKIGTTIIVSPPITISADLEFPFVESTGELVQLNEIRSDDNVLPFVQADGLMELFLAINGDVVLPWLEIDGAGSVYNTLDGELVLPFVDSSGEIRQDIFINIDATLPYVVVSGRTKGEVRESPVGNAPALIGAVAPEDGIRTGGGVFLNFDSFTLG